jgi:hypothetical protein
MMVQANPNDLSKVVKLYNDLHDALAKGINYPGWIKHVYPNAETAAEGFYRLHVSIKR